MKSLILLDVDGTIAESSQTISDIIRQALERLLLTGKYELGIVGGSKYEKIMQQLDGPSHESTSHGSTFHGSTFHGSTSMTHIFSENGCVYHKNGVEIFRQNIRLHPLYPQMNKLIKVALGFLSTVDYLLTGQLIDLRSGIIYISLIGAQATLQERAYFIDLDAKFGYREQLLNLLKEKANTMDLSGKIDVLLGGSVGIGIHPHEWDKVQVLDYISLTSYESIHYFGDKYKEDGNDYRLLSDKRVIGHCVNSISETADILNSLVPAPCHTSDPI